MSNREPRIVACLAAFLMPFCLPLASVQATVIPAVSIQVGPEGSPISVDETMLASNSASVVENLDGSVSFLNGSMMVAGLWQWDWSDLTVKTDPFVSSAFGFKNLAAVPMTFVVTVDLPVIPIATATLIGGSMGGSVTDANFDGLGGVSTVTPAALYTGRIDAINLIPTAELHPDPFSTAPFLFAGDTSSIPSTSFGLPGPTVPGPAVTTSIGIENKFSLSPGDIVAMTNFFIVEPVPEPSSIVLAMLAGVALVWCGVRRRRRP